METRIGNRTLFMLHGDECTFVKGHIVERIQINMLFAAALHILYLLTFVVVVVVVVIGGGGYSFSARLSRPL